MSRLFPLYAASKTLGLHYVEIPKSACASITAALLKADGQEVLGNHHRHNHFRTLCREGYYAPFAFTFVRHPIDRLVSCWREKIGHGRGSMIGCELPKTASFDEFAEWALSQDPATCDVHFAPQSRAVEISRRTLDFTGRLESMDADWSELQRRFPGLPDLEHRNRTDGPDVEISDAVRAKAAEFYAADFERWGYK